MLDFEKARELMAAWLAKTCAHLKNDVVLLDTATITKPYGWVFMYTSRMWLETRDIQYAIAGNGPVVVMAETGEIVTLGTARPSAEMIEQFERDWGLTG